MDSRWLARIGMLLVALTCCEQQGPRLLADEPPTTPPSTVWQVEIAKLVEQLTAARFAQRREASSALLRIGQPALPALAAAAQSPSAELRLHARRLAMAIEFRELSREFERLGRQKEDAAIDVEEALWLVTRILEPQVRRTEITEQLDALALRVRERLGRDANPRNVAPPKAVEALCQVLFGEFGLAGNVNDYNNPANSSVAHVLRSKRGLPILLSEIVVAVGRRVGLPIQGLPWPGRYVVRYDGSQAPAGMAAKDIVFDPYLGGRILTDDEIRQRGILDPLALTPATRRATIARVLRNLASAFRFQGAHERATLVERYLEAFDAGEQGTQLDP